jgi:hypothetical protein
MPDQTQHQAVVETITMLAEQIARSAPECADSAMKIVELARELGPGPDRETIKDTLDAATADTDVSDARIETTVDAVAKAARDEP